MPADARRASRRESWLQREAKAVMEAYEDRSSGQTSMVPGVVLEGRLEMMSCFAFSPASVLRHARIRCEQPSRAMCRAASRPRPVLAPVTITVSLANDRVGVGGVTNSWE